MLRVAFVLRSTEVHPVFSGLFPSTPKETKHAHGTGACCSAAITAIATTIAPFPIPTTTPRPPPSSSLSACYCYYSYYDCKYLFTYLPTFLLACLPTHLLTYALTYLLRFPPRLRLLPLLLRLLPTTTYHLWLPIATH